MNRTAADSAATPAASIVRNEAGCCGDSCSSIGGNGVVVASLGGGAVAAASKNIYCGCSVVVSAKTEN